MAETDRISDLLTAEERGEIRGVAKGEAKGKMEGRAEGKMEVIALLEKGFSLEEIKKMLADKQ